MTQHCMCRSAAAVAVALLVLGGICLAPVAGFASQSMAIGVPGDPGDGFGVSTCVESGGGGNGDPTDGNGGDPTDGEGWTITSGDPTDGEDGPAVSGDPGDGSEAVRFEEMPMFVWFGNALCALCLATCGLRFAR